MTRNRFPLIFAGVAAIIAIALLIVSVLGEAQRYEHGGGEAAAPAPAPPSEVTAGGFKLTVRLDPEHSKVGEVTAIQGQMTDSSGALVRNVRYELVSFHLEDEVPIFRTTFVAPDGLFSWGNQFWDGTEHELRLTASPGPGATQQFSALTLRRVVEVEAVPPTMANQLRALFYLLLPVAVGLAIGIPLGLRVPTERPAAVRSSRPVTA
ncbi:MAG: hypothetical protein ACRDI2_15355 [Chloroflexota bacterium]